MQSRNIVSLVEYLVEGMIDGESSSRMLAVGKVSGQEACGEGAMRVVGYVVVTKEGEYFLLHTPCDNVVLSLIYQRTQVVIVRSRVEEILQLVRLETDYT